ncbi:CaiB/BaiF CoA transferase family protein [Flavisphingomonas formosensis]|uniref:CaiB/BaiF CoA transferase family protein n=1 Tax=Flavisphingomonas formosensis TaxID=861534 RepID=UPI0012F92017|nr:CoA transferase [Sphingomonas formosensis]
MKSHGHAGAPGPATGEGPLAGVKIIDLTSVLMGPFATQILAQLGADVIKVESPEGDDMRRIGPMRSEGMGAIFLQANHGKRSIVLNLKESEDRAALLSLIAGADVFVSNVRPAALERLGLDYESVAASNPRLIYVNCCGFNPDGPYGDLPAYDDLIQGATAIPWLMNEYLGTGPAYAPLTLSDRIGGLNAVYAITTALYARERSGVGQAVSVPLFEATAQFVMGDHLGGHLFDPPIGPAGYRRLLTPHRRPYRTNDGYLCILIYNDKHWRAFFGAIGDPGRMERDHRFANTTARAENIDAVYAELGEIIRQRSTTEWRALLDAADIPNAPVNMPTDLLTDEHLFGTGFVSTTEHPTEGRVNLVRNPIGWSGTPLPAHLRPAPLHGEHSREVLDQIAAPPSNP